jgi:hypothetical protein
MRPQPSPMIFLEFGCSIQRAMCQEVDRILAQIESSQRMSRTPPIDVSLSS